MPDSPVSSTPVILSPRWPAPARVRAAVTTRTGGCSQGVHASLNLGEHCGDDPAAVRTNRQWLAETLVLPGTPQWLRQVHGRTVVHAPLNGEVEADAAWSDVPGTVCVVMAADCLPVLFCDTQGTVVAAAHAGWRGLAGGVLEAAVAALPVLPERLLAWLGPAIGPTAFEVGPEVRAAFVERQPTAATAFKPGPRAGSWRADLYALARLRLGAAGVGAVYGGDLCTYSDPQRFFSYRRDGATGRMAALIWLTDA